MAFPGGDTIGDGLRLVIELARGHEVLCQEERAIVADEDAVGRRGSRCEVLQGAPLAGQLLPEWHRTPCSDPRRVPAGGDTVRQVAALTGPPDFSSNPVLVVGAGRSGTSALLKALGEHPQLVAAPGEAPLERAIAAMYGELKLRGDKFFAFVTSQTRAPQTYIEDSLRTLVFESAFGPNHGAARLEQLRADGKSLDVVRRWICKVGGIGAAGLEGFVALYPNFRGVHIHRDGIENVASRMKFKNFRDQSFEQHCRTWAEAVTASRVLRSRDDVVAVRHADLIDRPEELFTELASFLDVDPDPAPARHAASVLTHPLDQSHREGVDVRQELLARRSPAEDWSVAQRRTFADICGPAMMELGYELDF